MPDDVDPDTEFKLAVIDAAGSRKEGEYFVKETGVMDAETKPLFEYAELDPIDDFRCGIKEDIELPPGDED